MSQAGFPCHSVPEQLQLGLTMVSNSSLTLNQKRFGATLIMSWHLPTFCSRDCRRLSLEVMVLFRGCGCVVVLAQPALWQGGLVLRLEWLSTATMAEQPPPMVRMQK